MTLPRKVVTKPVRTVLLTRRAMLTKGAATTLVAAAVPFHVVRAALCQNPEELSYTDYSFRKYVEFTESWPNEQETCRHCAAFIPGPDEKACGTCRAIAGSINPGGHCTGWEPKKAGA